MSEGEVIMEIGGEGGSIILFGFRTERGWSFSREVTECIDEDRTGHKSVVVGSWRAALKLVDRYPWCNLFPVRIHPEFKQKIWAAVQERLHRSPGISQHQLGNWRKLCGTDTAG